MSKTLLFETKSVLSELRDLKRNAAKQSQALSDFDAVTMTYSCRKGSSKKQYYVKAKRAPGKRNYLGTEKSATVKNIQAARYYKELLQVVERDIKLLESIEQNYIIPDHNTINNLLPKVYRNEVLPAILHTTPAATEWKRQKEAEKAMYEPYRPEDLIHTAKDGTKMRSLSETLIANYLLSLGITFVYELPLTSNGRRIWPDFTILSPVDNKTVIIIEHQGAMDSEKYQAKFIRTILFYLSTELVPNKDVFFTFNHLDRHLDLRQLDYILHEAFGYTAPQPISGRGIS